jgi:hypothetical protein
LILSAVLPMTDFLKIAPIHCLALPRQFVAHRD